MFEGRDNNAGWLLVASAVVALVVFAGLLYVRGGSAPRLVLGGGGDTAVATPRPTPSRTPVASSPARSGGPSAAPSRGPAATGAVAAVTNPPSDSPSDEPTAEPTSAPTRTPRPTATPRATPKASPKPTPKPTATAAAGFHLPRANQKATVALEHGQGDCPNFPVGGVVVESTFSQPAAGRLTATSPSGQQLTGRVRADGSFSLSAENPTERWVGSLTETGGTGSYFVVSNGCTEGYETTIAFH